MVLEILAMDVGLLVLAVVLPFRLVGEAAASSATQASPAVPAIVSRVDYPTYYGKSCNPCVSTVLTVMGLPHGQGGWATLRFHHLVDGTGMHPGAFIAVRQDPADPAHVELPGYPATPRARQVYWSVAAVTGMVVLAVLNLFLIRGWAAAGHLGHRAFNIAVRWRRPPRPRTPFSQLPVGRMLSRVALFTFGIPLVVGGYATLLALGATARSQDSVSTLPALVAPAHLTTPAGRAGAP